MDYFYDGQIRRYITQFMRVFIGFKCQLGDELRTVPVTYGDMTRQVANIIKENSENKLPTVPKISCYMNGFELDTTRLSDSTFVSKVNVRERRWTEVEGERVYQNIQGAGYTVERLMPTPFKLSMKADIWTSSTDQKLQLLEQILVLFNPSLELQTTDNYIDWTSISTLYLKGTTLTSRTIPAGTESDIDICTLEFEMPVWLSPPAKVKKLGIVQSIISNIFTEQGDVVDLENLVYNKTPANTVCTTNRYRILMFKSNNNQPYDFDISILDTNEALNSLDIEEREKKTKQYIDWNTILEYRGGYRPGSRMYFRQKNGYEIVGTFVVNEIDPNILIVTFDQDTIPTNTVLSSAFNPEGKTYIDAIIDPYKFNPLTRLNGRFSGVRYLMLDDVNPDSCNQDGPDAWKNLDGSDPEIYTNTIIEWDGEAWIEIWNPVTGIKPIYIQNLKTGIQYRWDEINNSWIKSFEGEYYPEEWGFIEDRC
jgi:hypothetical protein